MIKDLYNELSGRIKDNLPEIKWIDLWHDQVGYLAEEHPFPAPAIFMAFRIRQTEDVGTLVQQLHLQVDFYLFYETFTDTYMDSICQDEALEFLETLTRLHALFHGRSGNHFSGMRRVELNDEESGNAGNLYRVSFECVATDYTAQVLYDQGTFPDIEIIRGTVPLPDQDDAPAYDI